MAPGAARGRGSREDGPAAEDGEDAPGADEGEDGAAEDEDEGGEDEVGVVFGGPPAPTAGAPAEVTLDRDGYLSGVLRLGGIVRAERRRRRRHVVGVADVPVDEVLGDAADLLPAMARYERAHPDDPIVAELSPYDLAVRERLAVWALMHARLVEHEHHHAWMPASELALLVGVRSLASFRRFDAQFGAEGALRREGLLDDLLQEDDPSDPFHMAPWPASGAHIIMLRREVWLRMIDGRLPSIFCLASSDEERGGPGSRHRPRLGRLRGEDDSRPVGTLLESVPERPLILPPKLAEKLDWALEAVPLRKTVAVDMGYGELLGYGLGTVLMFEGPPGTGKTLAAHVVAHRLGRPLLVVGAADLLDRWVGSTEEAIHDLFARAKKAGAVLLIDEADSLLRARASADHRWEVSFVNTLLRCIEHSEGVVVLTTNFIESLDTALERRLTLRMCFPKPGPAERARIWRALVGDRLHLPKACAPEALARWPMLGSQIKSAVLDMAICGARRGSREVTAEEVERAIERARGTGFVRARGPVGFEPAGPGQDDARR